MVERRYDVVVIGAGMVGATAACLLARAGFSVAVVEAREPQVFRADDPVGLRVSAISPGSEAVLKETGAWRQISQGRHCAYRRMRVEDRDSRAALEFNAGEFALERLGTVVENDLVQWSLWQCLQNQGGVEVICPVHVARLDTGDATVHLQSGRAVRAQLVVGADGSDSTVRNALGIGKQTWYYGQQGIVAVVQTAWANDGIAWQRFLPGGPLALLPLADGSSSIVWSVPDAESQRLLVLDDGEFCAELNAVLSGTGAEAANSTPPFGAVVGCGPRAAFPLFMQLSDAYAAHHAVLVGDAAHVVHPLAGQGVNLGFLDAAVLVEVLLAARQAGEDIASEKVLGRYARWRRSEAELMARGIHGIRSLFVPDLLAPLRQLGLGLVSRSWILKEAFFRRAAGRDTNAPALARGVGLTDLLTRSK